MKLTISLIAILGSLLFISPIFGDEKLQCKSNQECIKLRDCPYTKKILTRVLSSSDMEEKNGMLAEMRKLVCNPLDRSVCCDKEEYETEDEGKGDHEESDHEMSDPEAEGDHEESNPEAEAEGDHEESEAEAEDDHEESEPGDYYYDSEPEASGDYYYDSEVEAEGDHEESEAVAEGSDYDDQNKVMDTLGKFIAYEKLIS